jgi:20S proteasome alpha/beta subunit
MSLGIAIKGAEGVVLAAESRVTLTVQINGRTPTYNSF